MAAPPPRLPSRNVWVAIIALVIVLLVIVTIVFVTHNARPTATPSATATQTALQTATEAATRTATQTRTPGATSSSTATAAGHPSPSLTPTMTNGHTPPPGPPTAQQLARLEGGSAPGAPPTPLVAPPVPPTSLALTPQLADMNALVTGPLDGLPTPRRLAMRRPLAIVVENIAPAARPQTGLTDASVVYEALAEFGITRFLAVYVEHNPPLVGPVRSARIYFNSWAAGWHAIFTHAGGNADALDELWHLPELFNIDEVATEISLYNTGTDLFERTTDRTPPENLYTFPTLLRAHVAATKHWTIGYSPAVLAHKAPLPIAKRPSSGSIDIAFSSYDYAVHYTYDPRTNTYLRMMGGAPHVDSVTGQQIAPANVVVFFTSVAPDPAGDSAGAISVQTVGSGPAYFFIDGEVHTGQWSKASVIAPLLLTDAQGRPMQFNPGQTWIEVVPQGNSVTWNAVKAP